jgi:hypothetical protein
MGLFHFCPLPLKSSERSTEMKCEGTKNCTCEVEQQKSIERDGKYYCDEACASGHPNGKGCNHQGYNC